MLSKPVVNDIVADELAVCVDNNVTVPPLALANEVIALTEEFVIPARVWEILQESKPDYVMDCIDSVTPKLEWLKACKRLKIKVISHLGAGGKMDPSCVQVSKLNKTYNCKLASHLKKRLKREKVEFDSIRAVFSSELQIKSSLKLTDGTNYKKSFYGTVSYMPGLFGLMGAAEVIRYLSKHKIQN